MSTNVPIRTSSLAAWTETNLNIKESLTNLKRKRSCISVEEDPIAHQRLKVEQVEILQTEQRHLKTWFDIERNDQLIDTRNYKKAHRETNKRLVSLGEEYWKENQTLRALEEKAGIQPTLGPDSEGAFAAVLMRLYKDPTAMSTKRSSRIQTKLRNESIVRYESKKNAPKSYLYCPINQVYHEEEDIVAAHIVPYHLGPEIFEYLFGSGAGTRVFSPDNCLMIHTKLEKHFYQGHFVLLPVDPKESPIRRWRLQITNDDARNSEVGLGLNVKLGDLQDRELIFKNDARPAARFLYYHFVVTLLRNSHYKTGNHSHYCTTLPTGKPFATIGKYFRRSMLYALARRAGDVDEAAKVLIETATETTFEAGKQKLSDEEESEIARRMLEAMPESTI